MSDFDWDTKTQAFIQWKGTDACMDLHCPKCEHHNHYDGYFAYYVQCANCKAVFKMDHFVRFAEADPTDVNYSSQHPKQSEMEEDRQL